MRAALERSRSNVKGQMPATFSLGHNLGTSGFLVLPGPPVSDTVASPIF